MNKVTVIKKDGTRQEFNPQKILNAVDKSAYRALSPLTDEDKANILKFVEDYINLYDRDEITVPQMHNLVESALDKVKPEVAKSYRDYRNYKTDFVEMINSVYKKAQSIMYIGDKENSNTDSALVSTKRSLIFNQLNKELYQKFFMTTEELQACREGYIYVHDMSARRDTMNCMSRNTRFLTKDGVKEFTDFEDGDEVDVISHTGETRHAVVHSYGEQQLQTVIFEKEVDGRTFQKLFHCTANHRWILKDGSDTTNLKVGDEIYRSLNGDQWYVKEILIEDSLPEVVWCLEVPVDHSFILEGGIITGNCCLCDISKILEGGFEMANIWYNEPKSLDTAFDVMGDIVLSAASQQYGGFTVPRVDEVLSKYAELSYQRYKKEGTESYCKISGKDEKDLNETEIYMIEQEAEAKVYRDAEQGFQGWEYKFNTVSSSRGDYPFTTISIGIGTDKWAKMMTKACLRVRAKGQGAPGKKRVVLFPKIIFTYTEDLHGEGKINEDLFEEGIECSSKAMYPDWLSLDGDTTIAEMWHKYGEVVAAMGYVAMSLLVVIRVTNLLNCWKANR